VADRGIGISDADKNHIFDTFYRVRRDQYGGTGLGLAITQRIVERHGGTIAVSDNPGGGTRFTVTMPDAVVGRPSGAVNTATDAVRPGSAGAGQTEVATRVRAGAHAR
jgi:hypothetical protein